MLPKAIFYLVKLYTRDREILFSESIDGYLELSNLGQIAADEWLRSSLAYRCITLDKWLVRPDHLISIISLQKTANVDDYMTQSGKPRLLSAFVASYKAAAAKRINLLRNVPGGLVWQRSYQEKLISDNTALQKMRQRLIQSEE